MGRSGNPATIGFCLTSAKRSSTNYGEAAMLTIVTYTDDHPPLNHFPRRIISPTRSGLCCFSAMEPLGAVRREGRWEYAYWRCRTCGFTMRVIMRYLPDQTKLANLRKHFDSVLSR